MNRVALLFLAGLVACDQADPVETKPGGQGAPEIRVLELTPGELSAKASLEKIASERRQIQALERRVNEAMQVVLIDPFSAQYRELRTGRNGAVCGQVNGKNRLGAYVGFKDFVLEKDQKSVFISRMSDGVETEMYSYFATSFVKNCANKLQVARYNAATAPVYNRFSEDASRAAEEAAKAAADAAAENVEMPAEEATTYW